MKKIILAIATVIAAFVLPSSALADVGFNVGYAQSTIEHGNTLRGVNIKYYFEPVILPFGFMMSFTSLNNNEESMMGNAASPIHIKDTARQYNLLIGRSFSVIPSASVYGLIGAAYKKDEFKFSFPSSENQHITRRDTSYKASLAYGAGIRISSMANFVIDLGYEGNHTKMISRKLTFDGFNIGVGYRF